MLACEKPIEPRPQPVDRRKFLLSNTSSYSNTNGLTSDSISSLSPIYEHNKPTSNELPSVPLKSFNDEMIDNSEEYLHLKTKLCELQKKLTLKTIEHIKQEIILHAFFPALNFKSTPDKTILAKEQLRINLLKKEIKHLKVILQRYVSNEVDYQTRIENLKTENGKLKTKLFVNGQLKEHCSVSTSKSDQASCSSLFSTNYPRNLKNTCDTLLQKLYQLTNNLTEKNQQIDLLTKENAALQKALKKFSAFSVKDQKKIVSCLEDSLSPISHVDEKPHNLEFSLMTVNTADTYKPLSNDPIDIYVADFTNQRNNKVIFTRVKRGLYLFGRLLVKIVKRSESYFVVHNNEFYTLPGFINNFEDQQYELFKDQAQDKNELTSHLHSSHSEQLSNLSVSKYQSNISYSHLEKLTPCKAAGNSKYSTHYNCSSIMPTSPSIVSSIHAKPLNTLSLNISTLEDQTTSSVFDLKKNIVYEHSALPAVSQLKNGRCIVPNSWKPADNCVPPSSPKPLSHQEMLHNVSGMSGSLAQTKTPRYMSYYTPTKALPKYNTTYIAQKTQDLREVPQKVQHVKLYQNVFGTNNSLRTIIPHSEEPTPCNSYTKRNNTSTIQKPMNSITYLSFPADHPASLQYRNTSKMTKGASTQVSPLVPTIDAIRHAAVSSMQYLGLFQKV